MDSIEKAYTTTKTKKAILSYLTLVQLQHLFNVVCIFIQFYCFSITFEKLMSIVPMVSKPISVCPFSLHRPYAMLNRWSGCRRW